MIRKCFTCFIAAFLILTTISISKSNAVILNISGDDVNKAIEYGKKNKRMSLGDFTKEWTVNLGREIGWATLYTGFHNVAFYARKADIEHKELTTEEINKALEISKDLTFTVSILGNNMDFAQEYHVMLKLDKTFIAPTFEFIPENAEPSEFWPALPDNIAGCVFKFPLEGIDPNSLVTLILKPFDGDVLQFPFDLSKIK